MAGVSAAIRAKRRERDIGNSSSAIVKSEEAWSDCAGFENTLRGIRLSHSSNATREPTKLQKNWLLENPWFETGIGLLAFLNAGQIGMAMDLTDGEWVTVWKVAEHGFTILFFVEMVLKLAVLHWDYFTDRWNLLDFCLVLMAVIDNWFLSWLVKDDSALGGFTILRILRLARIARVFRMVKHMQELVSLIEALVYSLRTMFWAYVLLFLMIYVYALICVECIGSYKGYPARSETDPTLHAISEDFNNYQFFGTVSRSMYSLFGVITLSEFSDITRPIFEMQPLFVLVLISFTCLSAFGVMNVVVGLMVQQALDVSNSLVKEKEEQMVNIQKQRILMIRKVLEELDDNHDSDISKEELKHAIVKNDELSELLFQIDLPQSISIDELFTLIDNSGDGRVTPEEFQAQLTRLLDCTQFQQLCLMQISLNEIKRLLLVNGTANKDVDLDKKTVGGVTEITKRGCAEGCLSPASDSFLNVITEIKRDLFKMRKEFAEKTDLLLTCIQKSDVETSVPNESTRIWPGSNGVSGGGADSRLEQLPWYHSAGAASSVLEKLESRSCEELLSEAEALKRSLADNPGAVPRKTPQVGLVHSKSDMSDRRKHHPQGCLSVESSCMEGHERQELNVERSGSNRDTLLNDCGSPFKADRHCCPHAV